MALNYTPYKPANFTPMSTPTPSPARTPVAPYNPQPYKDYTPINANTMNPRGGNVLGTTTNPTPQQRPQSTGFNDLQSLLQENNNQQMGEIDSLYSGLQDQFNQAESALVSQKQSALDAARAQWEAGQAQLGTGRDQSINRLTEQENMVDARTQDALSRARQLYNEQLMGFNQRFGATSSAGEASRALLGRESQRQFGDIRQEQTQTLNELQTRKGEVEQEFQAGLLQLQAAKQQAENDIRSRFQQALDQINSSRAASATEKANARMSALQELRNAMFELKVEEMNMSQQLQQQAMASSQALDQALNSFGGAVTGGEESLNMYDPQYRNTLQMGQRQTTTAPLTGPLSGNLRDDERFNYMTPQGPAFASAPTR